MQMRTQSKKHKIIRTVLLVILLLLIVAAGGFISVYEGRFQTISSIQKVTDYDEYNLYRMDVKYDYDLDRLIEYGITDNQSFVDAIVKEALPILPVHIKAPDFGCSAFTLQEADGNVLMGRNYDFKRYTSAMLVYCEPKGGYKSVAFAALVYSIRITVNSIRNDGTTRKDPGNGGKPRKIKGFSELMKRGGARIDTFFEKRAHFSEQKEKLSTLSTKRAGKPHKQRVPGSFLNWNE